MDLWQVRKRYRSTAARLRRMKNADPAVLAAEEQLLVTLLLGDRLETERSVFRYAVRSARARLRRLRGWLDAAVLAADMNTSLVRREDEPAVMELQRYMERTGATSAAQVIEQLRGELAHLEGRVRDISARLGRVSQAASAHFERLVRTATMATLPGESKP
jgi:hypothetical protein